VVTPEDRRTAVTLAMSTATISERRACRYTGFARSTQRYRIRRPPRIALRERLQTLAMLRPRWGYRRLYRLLRREGLIVNRKLVQRVYREEGLQVRRRARKRVAVPRVPLASPTRPNELWGMDFVSDALGNGRRFRALTIVDEMTREAPAIVVDFSLPGERVVRVLDELGRRAAMPTALSSTTARSFAAKRWISGPRGTTWRCILSSRASRFRTPLSKASTVAFVMNV
jgi:putative transposase